MSKLLIAFVHRDDAEPIVEALRAEGHRFTLLPSVGGFLSTENMTFVFGVEDKAEPADRRDLRTGLSRPRGGGAAGAPRADGRLAGQDRRPRRRDDPRRGPDADRPDLGSRARSRDDRSYIGWASTMIRISVMSSIA